MSEKTYISIEFWQLVSFAITIVVGYWGLAQKQLAQYQKQQQERHERQDKINESMVNLSKEFLEFQAKLPMTYVLRDDYIRGQAILEAKMDAVHKTLSEIYKMESLKK